MLRLKPLGLAMPSHPVRAWHACTSFCPRQDTGSPTGFFCAACSRGTGTVSMPAGSFHSRNPKTRIRLAELAGPRELLNFLPVLACVPLTLPFRTLSVWLLTRTDVLAQILVVLSFAPLQWLYSAVRRQSECVY